MPQNCIPQHSTAKRFTLTNKDGKLFRPQNSSGGCSQMFQKHNPCCNSKTITNNNACSLIPNKKSSTYGSNLQQRLLLAKSSIKSNDRLRIHTAKSDSGKYEAELNCEIKKLDNQHKRPPKISEILSLHMEENRNLVLDQKTNSRGNGPQFILAKRGYSDCEPPPKISEVLSKHMKETSYCLLNTKTNSSFNYDRDNIILNRKQNPKIDSDSNENFNYNKCKYDYKESSTAESEVPYLKTSPSGSGLQQRLLRAKSFVGSNSNQKVMKSDTSSSKSDSRECKVSLNYQDKNASDLKVNVGEKTPKISTVLSQHMKETSDYLLSEETKSPINSDRYNVILQKIQNLKIDSNSNEYFHCNKYKEDSKESSTIKSDVPYLKSSTSGSVLQQRLLRAKSFVENNSNQRVMKMDTSTKNSSEECKVLNCEDGKSADLELNVEKRPPKISEILSLHMKEAADDLLNGKKNSTIYNDVHEVIVKKINNIKINPDSCKDHNCFKPKEDYKESSITKQTKEFKKVSPKSSGSNLMPNSKHRILNNLSCKTIPTRDGNAFEGVPSKNCSDFVSSHRDSVDCKAPKIVSKSGSSKKNHNIINISKTLNQGYALQKNTKEKFKNSRSFKDNFFFPIYHIKNVSYPDVPEEQESKST